MDPRVAPLWAGFRLHTRLLVGAFDEVDDGLAAMRLEGGNSMAFLAVHLADARAFLVRMLGGESPEPFPALAAARGLDDVDELPPVEAVLAAWLRAADDLDRRLPEVTAAELDADAPQGFPLADGSVLGGLVFLYSHEAYHLGQLGLLRRAAGLAALRWR